MIKIFQSVCRSYPLISRYCYTNIGILNPFFLPFRNVLSRRLHINFTSH
nr:MAG TPA: hypothetical protein [Caudoviricetes sp.]